MQYRHGALPRESRPKNQYRSRILTEDGTQQSLFRSQFGLSLRSNFTHQDITGTNLCTDTNDTSVIQILQCIITDTGYITGDLFRSKLGVTCFCLILLNMNGSIHIITYQSLT